MNIMQSRGEICQLLMKLSWNFQSGKIVKDQTYQTSFISYEP